MIMKDGLIELGPEEPEIETNPAGSTACSLKEAGKFIRIYY